MTVNDFGQVAVESWLWLGERYHYVELDQWIIMPNHLHGILIITDDGRGGSRTAPAKPHKPLGRLIGAFKTISTKSINQIRHTPGQKIWQRNYFERIIRNDKELFNIQKYIINNPQKWELEREKPLNMEFFILTGQAMSMGLLF